MRYRTSQKRPGTVTVVVVAFLALLLIMGLSFAFYALRESEESRVFRDSVNGGQTGVFPALKTSSSIDDPPEPDTIANRTLGDIIYGPSDDLTGAFNVLRQHELARSIYGWNPKFPSPYWPYDPMAVPPPPGFVPVAIPGIGAAAMDTANRAALQPFNGFGRVSPTVIGQWTTPQAPLPDTMINFAWVPSLSPLMYDIDNNYARDPRNPNALVPFSYAPVPAGSPPGTPGDRYWAKNADYTYPDNNNFFLAAVDPMTGKVLIPSYHRPWLVNNQPPPPNPGPGQPLAIDPNNPWTSPTGRLQMLRPRPVDNQWPPNSSMSEFPYPSMNPDGTYGDVELLTGKSIGRQLDALWLDPDLPVRTWRGKSYKPLVAMLILDFDGRINLNTAGNFYQPDPANQPQLFIHGSNQGVGPQEVNPSKVLLSYPDPMNPTTGVPNSIEAARLTLGTQNPNLGTMAAHARYGITWLVTATGNIPIWVPLKQYGTHTGEITTPYNPQQIGQNQTPPGSGAHFYSGVDYEPRNIYTGVVPQTGQGTYSSDDTDGHGTSYTWGWGAWGQAYTGQPGNPNDPPRPHQNNRYGSGYYIPNPAAGQPAIYDERSDHPSLFNPYLVRSRPWSTLDPGTGAAPKTIPNRAFGVEEMRNLNAQYNFAVSQSSQLAALAPSTLGWPAYRAGQLNSRFVTTTISNDFDLPGSGPARITGYLLQPQQQPQQAQPAPPPQGALGPVDPAQLTTPTDAFDESFRTRLNSLLGPVDLTRKLTDYRGSALAPLSAGNVGNTQRAISDRQLLARDIFQRLRVATGVVTDPTTAPIPGDATQRWLAQLAVNIVDFIDSDDCVTPFKWTDLQGGGAGQPLPLNEDPNSLNAFRDGVKNDWVFGFERPRVNINEAFVRLQNDPADPLKDAATGMAKATLPYDMTMWLELHNPLTPDAPAEQFSGTEGFVPTVPPNPPNNDDNIHGGYRAALKDTFTGAGDKSVYRVLVYKAQPWMAGPDPLGMRGYDNVAGVPTTATYQSAVLFTTGGDTVDTKGNSKGQQVIEPNLGAQYRDESFFLVGPQLDQKMGAGPAQLPTDPAPAESTANLTTKALQTKIPTTDFTIGAPPGWAPGFVLQRLACPALPPGQNNPYVTIDYFESDPVAINHRLKYDGAGNPGDAANAGNEPDWNTTYSWGRRQPYDGTIVYGDQQHYRQLPGGMAAAQGKINYTFGQHNGGTAMGQNQWPQQGDNTLQLPFNPLAHFDRVPLSPADLFHVVGTKPTEFTHVFRGPPSDPNNGLSTTGRLKYTADWLDHQVQPGQQGSFLYRALGLLRTQTSLDGLGMGGRVPGKININTIFNQAVFDAICDAQTGVNRFQQGAAGQAGTVGDAWKVLIAGRQAGAGGPTQMQIGPTDKPLRGYAISSIQDEGAILDRYRTPVTPDMLWSQSDATQSKENYAPGVSPAGRAADIEKYEMISKVMNQFTTRSNTFAVYMMIGYFEVRNPGPYNEANRPILGKELGTDDGTVVRHKYFAVIDRTNLSIEPTPLVAPVPGQALPPIKQGQPPVYFSYQPNTPLPSPPNYQLTGTEDPVPSPSNGPTEVRVPAIGQVVNPQTGLPVPGIVSGQYDGILWTIQAGVSQIEVDVGERRELTVVQNAAYDPTTNSAVLQLMLPNPVAGGPPLPLTQVHGRGAAMRLTNPDPSQPPSTPGNPGPQPGFNYKSPRYAPVVKYVEQLR